jgi:hypothetical protein
MTASLRIALVSLLLTAAVTVGAYADPYEEIFKDVDDEEAYTGLLSQLDTMVRAPVNLVEAGREDLALLPWVSPWLAREIVALRESGGLTTIDDLMKIQGVDRRLVDLLRPFVVVVVPAKRARPVEAHLRSRVIASRPADSYRDLKTYLRMGLAYSAYDAGILAEKDRGETRFNDFQTAYAGLRMSQYRLLAGDFVMVSGHGLVFSSPYGYSPSTVEPWRFSQGDFGVKPYTSVDENFGLRGLAFQYEGEHTGLCLAVSQVGFDAGLDEDGRVTSLRTTGLHVDSDGKDQLREDLVGVALRSERGGLGLTLDVLLSRHNRRFAIPRLDWMGSDWKAIGSCDLALLGDATVAFLQGAISDGGGAAIAGFGYDRRSLELLVLGRYYGERFLSLHARPFAFYSGYATGERGLLTRLAFRPLGKARVSIGNDLHKRRSEDSGLSSPSGSESFLDIEIPAGDLVLSLGEKLLLTEEPPARPDDPTETRTRLRSRLDISYPGARWFEIRARYENLRFAQDHGDEHEISTSDLLRLDLALEIRRSIVLKVGFHAFTIGSYGARIYQYEPGVPYYPAIEMLKSDGSRWYSVLSFGTGSWGKLAAKYAVTVYEAGEDVSQFMAYYSVKI